MSLRLRRVSIPLFVIGWLAGCTASFVPSAAAENEGGARPVLRVGSGHELRLPSQAAAIAPDGAIIEIEPEVYSGDVAVWTQDGLTLRGVGGRPHLEADGKVAEDKAIWVIRGRNTRVGNLEFSGARAGGHNGAGIRQEGTGLVVEECYFHDNENGILASGNPESDILVERSEFADNGAGDGRSHNLYIGRVRSFTLRFCYVHRARVGHNVKSRARTTEILYNRIMDERDGTSSLAVDIPDGGDGLLIGNLIQQGPMTENSCLVSYGAESGAGRRTGRMYVVNNTFANDRHAGEFIRNAGAGSARVYDNLFAGPGTIVVGPAVAAGNLVSRDFSLYERLVNLFTGGSQYFKGLADAGSNRVASEPGFVDRDRYDYRLRPGSPAIDAGILPGNPDGLSIEPAFQYVHPAGGQARPTMGRRDIGAYEYDGS